MFLAIRPSASLVDRFLRESQELPLSYAPVGILAAERPARGVLDEAVVAIGHGRADFARARDALQSWRQFSIGWVEVVPADARVVPGTVVAVLVHHVGFWSLNGCRVLYTVGGDGEDRFGFAYGTLTNHAGAGEELFEVFLDPTSGAVMYRILAVSWPRAPLARAGRPIVRALQARFRRHSAAAMTRAVRD